MAKDCSFLECEFLLRELYLNGLLLCVDDDDDCLHLQNIYRRYYRHKTCSLKDCYVQNEDCSVIRFYL